MAYRVKSLLEEIYNEYKKIIFKVAYNIVCDCYLAEDIVQETMLIIANEAIMDKLQYETVYNMKGYILTIAKNLAINEYNRQKRYGFSYIENMDFYELENSGNVAEYIMKQWEENKLHHSVEKLSCEDMRIINLRYFENFSCKEIGEIMHLSYDATRKRLERARKRLKKTLIM